MKVRVVDVKLVGDDRVIFEYSNGKALVVSREDYNRALGAIVNADYDAVVRDFAIEVIE